MDGNAVKNGLSFVLALAVIAVLGAGVLLLTGRYTYGEALTGRFLRSGRRCAGPDSGRVVEEIVSPETLNSAAAGSSHKRE